MQLGGNFIVDEQKTIRYAHRSAEPTDRPKAGELVKIMRTVILP